MRQWRTTAVALALSCACATAAVAQQTHVLIITGLGAEAQYSALFHAAATTLYETARSNWHVAPASLLYLAEDPATDSRITGKSTKDEIQKAFTAIGQRVSAGDCVFVFVLGHGAGDDVRSVVNIPGPDATAADYAMWIAPFTKQSVVFVNASSASGDFIKVLSGPGRVIVTATRSSFERNESVFAGPFVSGLTSGEADADKDGRISVLEAFDYARKETVRQYEAANKLMTEHATLSDSLLARTVAFGGAATSNDPKVVALVAERQALSDSVSALRLRKGQMDPPAYEKELERLLIAIAEKTQAIKTAGGKQ